MPMQCVNFCPLSEVEDDWGVFCVPMQCVVDGFTERSLVVFGERRARRGAEFKVSFANWDV